MPNPYRTYTITADNAFSSSSDQTIQFQEACYRAKVTATAAGWAVVRSSDGTTAGAADYWTSAGALEINTSGNGAWIVLSSPASWSSATVYLLMYINASGSNPVAMPVRMSTATYTSGSTSALPTTAGVETAVSTTPNILGHTSAATAYYYTWRTSRGDFAFATRLGSVSGLNSWLAVYSNTDASGGGSGNLRAWVHQVTNAASVFATLGVASAFGTSFLKALAPDGSVARTITSTSPAWAASSWTSGLAVDGTTLDATIDLIDNASAGRRLGQWIDVYGAPTSLPFGETISSESAQTYRRVSVGGGLWLYFPTADLPLAT